MLSQNYDSRNDILYLTFGSKQNSIGDEVATGYVVMRDIFTDSITGLTIFDFMKKYKTNNIPSYQLPININYQNDVLPLIV